MLRRFESFLPHQRLGAGRRGVKEYERISGRV
jgi:hypothetical protein